MATWYPTAFSVYRSGKGIPFYFFQDFPELALEQGGYALKMMQESLFLPLHILTGSTWLKEWIKGEYQKDAIVVGYGLKHEIFSPGGEKIEKTQKPCVMTIFREAAYKGWGDLVKGIGIVAREMPKITLLVVGDRSKIIRQLGGIDNIDNIVNVVCYEKPTDNELARLYRSADLFAFPSHVEGFGLPPLEAMACGTPVVTTDCFGVRDYAIHEGNALVVPPKQPEKLANAVIQLLHNIDLAGKLKTKGLTTAEKFTWDSVINKVENSFQKVIN